MTRKCKTCLEDKLLSDENFPKLKNKHGETFFRHICKPCHYAKYKEWSNENKELVLRLQKNWREGNADYKKRWHQENKRKQKEKTNKRRKEDSLYNLKWQINTLIYHSMRICGYSEKTKAFDLLGCTKEQLFKYLGISHNDDFEDKHLDHICPQDQARDELELKKLQHFSNLRLVPKEENMAKGAKRTPKGEEMCEKLLGRGWL